jgi:hypothetical protein
VAAVADGAGDHRGRERDPQAVPLRDGPDRLAHQHALVGGADRAGRRDRDLELAGRVLRVELVDGDPLVLQRDQHVAAVVAELDQPGHPVGRAAAGRKEVVVVAPDRPLDLDRHPERDVAGRRQLGHPPGEAALVGDPRLALLGEPVGRRPGPARLRGQRDDPVEVGPQPQVAVRAAEQAGAGDRIVGEEGVEDRGHADAPAHRIVQPGQRDGLDAVDPGRVHVRQNDGTDPKVVQPADVRHGLPPVPAPSRRRAAARLDGPRPAGR